MYEIKDRTKGGIFTHSVKNHFKWIRKEVAFLNPSELQFLVISSQNNRKKL